MLNLLPRDHIPHNLSGCPTPNPPQLATNKMKTLFATLIIACLAASASASDSVSAASKKNAANERDAICKQAGALAKIVVAQSLSGDPERERYWLSQMKSNTESANIVKYAYLRKSFMGPLEVEAKTYKACKLGQIAGLEDMKSSH
jgi:hypothetical protein